MGAPSHHHRLILKSGRSPGVGQSGLLLLASALRPRVDAAILPQLNPGLRQRIHHRRDGADCPRTCMGVEGFQSDYRGDVNLGEAGKL